MLTSNWELSARNLTPRGPDAIIACSYRLLMRELLYLLQVVYIKAAPSGKISYRSCCNFELEFQRLIVAMRVTVTR